jgi:SAM-dependent methyltransferase
MTHCAACECAELKPFFVGSDWFLGAVDVEERFPYVRCAACGTVAAHPVPTPEILERAYANAYYPSGRASLLERVLEPVARREARRVVTAVPAAGELLDVGCGPGRFMARLRASGWTGPMRGLEPDAGAAERASDLLGVPVRVGGVETLGDEAPGLSAVVLRHVIEHVPQPLQTLQDLRSLLAPGGVLYLGTPDARALSARVFGRYWHGYDPPRHLFAFTAEGMRALLERAGFAIEREHWDFAPQMWTGSLHHALARGRNPRWVSVLTSNVNPIAAVPAILGATVERSLGRSTMYAVLARVSG